MSKGDIEIIEPKVLSTKQFQVAAGADGTIKAGEPVVCTPGTATVALAADATPSVGTDYLIGIATTNSTDTTAAAGVVDVYVLQVGEIISMKAKVAANADTAAEILAIENDFLLMDLTSEVWTVDVSAGHAIASGLRATGQGEPENSRVYLAVRSAATLTGSDIAA